MKKRFFSALFLLMILLVCLPGRANAAGDVALNAANFPDEAFRAYVAQKFDTDGNGILSEAEIANATELDCAEVGISSLTGVEFLTNLTKLVCYGNTLTSLDLSKNVNLTYLDCSENILTSLDITNTNVEFTDSYGSSMVGDQKDGRTITVIMTASQKEDFDTYCADGKPYGDNVRVNAVTKLAISTQPVSTTVSEGSTAFFKVAAPGTDLSYQWQWKSADTDWANCSDDIEGYNTATLKPVATLERDGYQYRCVVKDSDGNTVISDAAAMNVVVELNATNFPDANFRAVVTRSFDKNYNGSLSASEITNATLLDCNAKGISSLEGVQFLTNLEGLYCVANQLTSLDVSGLPNLTVLSCGSNSLTSLDVTQNVNLKKLYCDYNELTSLDVTKNVNLTYLYCWDNSLTSLDVTKNVNLTDLDCRENSLTSLDVTKNVNLTYLDCSNNELTSLDVTQNVNLTYLHCAGNRQFSGNSLTSLDVTQNMNLTDLDCCNNKLTNLNVSQNMNLTYLDCSNNELTSLDVTKNVNLERLFCERNELTCLDISKNVNLTDLNCRGNYLNSLDVSQNVNLTYLHCEGNSLTSLDVTNTKVKFTDNYESSSFGNQKNNQTITVIMTASQKKDFDTYCADGAPNGWNARVSVGSKLTISTQPVSTTVMEGGTASFEVAASEDASYQWQWRTGDSGTWANCSSATAGYNTANLQPVATTARNGYQYRCVVKDAYDQTAISDAATLTVTPAPLAITTQPVSVSVTEGSTASFTVVATGAATYQWQWRASASGTWTDCSSATSGYNTATLKPVGTDTRNGYQYRCVVKDASGKSVTSNAATLTVFAITTQPASTTVTEGSTASFTVVATGASTYQWQWKSATTDWANCSSATSGYNTATLKPVATAARNGYQYRCVVKDSSGKSVTSNAATLTVKSVTLAITTQPAGTTVTEGSTASFKVVATGASTYQWQWRASASGTWTDCSSATAGYNTANLKPVATTARNGYQYRCIVKDASGKSITSNAATLTVKAAFAITTQPVSVSIAEGNTATFKVVATGASTYQWQWKSATTDWANCSSATSGYNTATLKPVATTARNGYQYRCIVKDASGKSITSNAATLTVKAAFAITTQPVSVSIAEGSTASFKVVATGAASYQWQWRASASGTWANCSSATSGYNTANLKPVATLARNGYQYRCVVKDASGKSITSNAATLTVRSVALAITAQPASTTVTEGSTASFKVVATGASSYQWQWRPTSSGTWADCSSATSGYNASILKPVATAARNGYQYRCIVKNASGKSLTSNTVTMTVKPALTITTQPVSVTVSAGSTATFKVAASGASSYQWQWRTGSAGTWANSSSSTVGYNTAVLKPVGTTARNGYQYRCVIKDSYGQTVTSNVVTLTVKSGPTITSQPSSQNAVENATAIFTVSADGTGLTYQWQWRASASGTWKNCSSATAGYNTAVLKPVATAARNGYQYRCVITDASGNSVTSNAAALTVF